MNAVIIDNHDSFTYNLVQLLYKSGAESVSVIRNEAIPETNFQKFDKIVIGPGPGVPSEHPGLKAFIRTKSGQNSILGVCLGFQAIVEAFGGTIRREVPVVHGITSEADILETSGIFSGLKPPVKVGRYHSWIVETVPDPLKVTAVANGIIMAIRHKHLDIQGVQFHPESFLTPRGSKMMYNWLHYELVKSLY